MAERIGKFIFTHGNLGAARHEYAFARDNALLFSSALAAFFVPFAFHSNAFPNQLIVGTFVNALLAGSAIYFPFRKALPVILLPSIAALASGFVFGGLSQFLVFLVPAIWLGNAAYVYLIKLLKLGSKMNYGVSVAAASVCKALIIGVFTFALVFFGVVPQALLVPMSLVQFVTAICGGAIAGAVFLLRK